MPGAIVWQGLYLRGEADRVTLMDAKKLPFSRSRESVAEGLALSPNASLRAMMRRPGFTSTDPTYCGNRPEKAHGSFLRASSRVWSRCC